MIETDIKLNNNRATSLKDLRHEVDFCDVQNPVIVGKAQVVLADQNEEGANNVQGILEKLAEIGILRTDDNVQSTINSAIKHIRPSVQFFDIPTFVGTELKGRKHFVNAKVLTQKESQGKYHWLGADYIKPVDKINVVSGNCLFGSAATLGTGESGKSYSLTDPFVVPHINERIVDFKIDQRIQPYEVDAILRLFGFLSNFNPNMINRISIAEPKIEYLLYGMQLYEKGLMDGNLLLEWFDEVDTRTFHIDKIIRRRINPDFNLGEPLIPLAPIEQLIKDGVKKNKKGLLPEAINILKTEDELWKRVFEVSKEVDSFEKLTKLNYQVGYLKQLESDIPLIAVENVEEVGILSNTKDIIKKIVNEALVIGLYVHSNVAIMENIETSPENGNRALYFYNPRGRYINSVTQVARMNK